MTTIEEMRSAVVQLAGVLGDENDMRRTSRALLDADSDSLVKQGEMLCNAIIHKLRQQRDEIMGGATDGH